MVTGNGKYAYTTNAGSGSVSEYAVDRDGPLALLDANGQSGLTGAGPADAALGGDSRLLYMLAAGAHQVVAFEVGPDHSLRNLGQVSLPPGAVGIAVLLDTRSHPEANRRGVR